MVSNSSSKKGFCHEKWKRRGAGERRGWREKEGGMVYIRKRVGGGGKRRKEKEDKRQGECSSSIQAACCNS